MGKYSLSLAEIQREVDKVNNARTLPVLQKVTEPITSTSNPQGVKNSLGEANLKLPSLIDLNKAKWEPNEATLPLSNPTQGVKALMPSTPADKLDTWLSDGYKLSKEEEKEAKAYIKEYRKNNRYPIGQPDATKDEIDNFNKVVNLESKLSAGTAFWSGLVDSLPFVDAIQDKMVSNNETASKVLDENRTTLQSASEQSPVMAATGRLTGELAKYNAGSQIAKAIPVLNKATNAVGSAAEKITKSKGLGEAAKNIIGDTALDVALDTIPSAVENAQSGMSAGEVAKEAGKNIGTNLAFNVGGEVIGSVAKKILPKLSKGVNDSVKEPGKYSLSQIVEKISKKSQNEIFDPVEKALKDPNVGKNHTAEQLKQMEDYYNSSDSGIIDFAKKARSGEYVKPIEITTVTDLVSQKIKELTGIDTVGNKVVLDKESLGHIDKRHGVNGSADNSMADDSTLSRIGYILNNYDGAVKGQGSNYLRLANGELAPTVVFYKKVDGTYYVVEAVTDAKSKTNRITSAYISDVKPEIASKKEAYQVPDAIIPRRTSEAELELTSFDNSIPVLSKDVNLPPKTGCVNLPSELTG